MRRASLISAILLFMLSFSASAYQPYEQQPGAYYYGPQPVYARHPERVAYAPRVYPQYRMPAYQRDYRPRYRPVRAYRPYAYPGHLLVEKQAPTSTDDRPQTTVAVTAQPDTVTKPKLIEETQPKKQAPKKALSDTKTVFLEKVAPMVHHVNKEVMTERMRLTELISHLDSGYELSNEQQTWLQALRKKYRVKGETTASVLRDELLPKVDIIPVELALAQAANESAWGKSRFAREARNLFGVWTYDESRGIVPKKRAKGAKHLVRKYESMEESIRHYINLLNSHPAYKALRDIRLQQRAKGEQLDGITMAAGLIKYSAKGEKYVAIIRSMINSNNLITFRSA